MYVYFSTTEWYVTIEKINTQVDGIRRPFYWKRLKM